MTKPESVWVAKAFCRVGLARAEYREGHRGAYVVVVCRAASLIEATQLIVSELAESDLDVRGFEHLLESAYLDRPMSEYEEMLSSRLASYPVQFENVHFFKPDT